MDNVTAHSEGAGEEVGTEDVVLVSRPHPSVTRIELNRPGRLNALDATIVGRLHEELERAERDTRCRVVVLAGRGRGFCAGLDLDDYGVVPGAEGARGVHRNLALQRHLSTLVQRVQRLTKPVVAEVDGPAAGAGLALVCAADLRIATLSSTFTTAFIRVGASGCDLGVSWLLPRLVGAGRAHELMLTGRLFDAEEALRIGLLADVVEAERLTERVALLVDQLLTASPLGLALTKQGMWLSLEVSSLDQAIELENRQQILLSQTLECSEAASAFQAGRSRIRVGGADDLDARQGL